MFNLSGFHSEPLKVIDTESHCQALHEASKAKDIWLDLCHPHLTPTVITPQMIHLERSIELYTSDELEFLFLRLEGAQAGWEKGDKCAAPVREVEITDT